MNTAKHATLTLGAVLATLGLMAIVGLAYALRPRDEREIA
jgi:hypothetical protein